MAAVRGRTVSTFGGFLMPVGLSGGSPGAAGVIHLLASYNPAIPLAGSRNPTVPLKGSYDPDIPLEAFER